MSGLVSDESAVGIGHYLGAEVVVTGTFDRYANFSQLRIRAVDVHSSAVAAMFTARIDNDDPVLAGVTAPLGNAARPAVSESAIALLNQGKDLYAEGKLDEAIKKLNAALAANKNILEAYFLRGNAYYDRGGYDRAIADYTAALRINPNLANAYNNRGTAYSTKGDYDRAIADYNTALRIDPNDADVKVALDEARQMRGSLKRAPFNYREEELSYEPRQLRLLAQRDELDRKSAYCGTGIRRTLY